MAEQAEADRLERVRLWAQDPSNASQLAHLRAEFDKVAPRQPAQKRPAAPAPAPQYKSRAQLEAERPWLRDPKPGSYVRIIDPKV
jgi:hypothetical protein